MDAVQAPIVPVIGGIIRQVPGTISLGQGVVHYGPPHSALDAVRYALTDASTHEYQDGAGLPALVERLAEKLRAENGIDVGRGTQLMVTAGANMAFVHAVLAITAPGRDHPERPVLLQPRDGHPDGRLHGGSRRHRRSLPAAPRRAACRHHRSHASHRHRDA
jgi:aspartate/methionine/tyrosine aminotransferase